MPRRGIVRTAELATIVARRGREAALIEIAERQHGVIALAQLVAIGFSPSAVRGRVASGRLRRLHAGVYAVAGVPLGTHGHALAAVLASGPGAVVSHRSAAALWGLRRSDARAIDVTSPGRAGRRKPGLNVHRADRLVTAEVTAVSGVPCTTVARTLVDLAGVLSPGPLDYAVHQAQIKRKLNRHEIAAVLARSPRRQGTAVMRRALGLTSVSEDRVRSNGERRLLRICAKAGLPTPRVNAWIAFDGDGVEVDFTWPEKQLAVEFDTRKHHNTDRAIQNDPSRDRRLTLAGWHVVRFTDRDVAEHPDAVAAQLRALLEL